MTWEYIAGFFDGEGHVRGRTASAQGYDLCIAQATENAFVLYVIAEFLAERGIPSAVRPYIQHWKRDGVVNERLMTELRISRAKDVHAFLVGVESYLFVKGDKARAIIEEIQEKMLRAEQGWFPGATAYGYQRED